ncbi:hypothetical protein TSAR_011396 [Trichomalopsis sarcophagae]|uniref:MADF domain-containing protein n=1 Tax=Trichomalopsis sarcophagae TaxID=543379 RepID=A0A232ETS6_9HYME|nr:hypothetical protein TSAR_011396 [Trichomalopsis sarcophagae]
MANLEEYQQQIVHDLVINYYMNNPDLYDKMDDGYIYTIDKIEKVKILTNYLKELDINISVSQLIKIWQSIVQQFKKCLNDEKKAGTGSAAIQHDFPYYQHLLFLKPAFAHRKTLTSGIIAPENMQEASGTFMSKEIPEVAAKPSSTVTSPSPRCSSATGRENDLTFDSPAPRSQHVPVYDVASRTWIYKGIPNIAENPSSTATSPSPSCSYATGRKNDLTFGSPAPRSQHVPAYNVASQTFIYKGIPNAAANPPSTATSPSTSCSSATRRNHNFKLVPPAPRSPKVPDLDEPAKKKLKIMAEDDKQIQMLQTQMLLTLQHVQQKMENPKVVQVSDQSDQSAIDFKHHLNSAFSKIPVGYEEQCMEYVLKQLEKFDQQHNARKVLYNNK